MDVNGKNIKVCSEYTYLGAVMSMEGNWRRDINNRIIQGKQAIQKLNSIWWSEQIKKPTKKRIYKSIVQSIVTYGSETWEITQRNKERLLAVEMDALRRSCRVSRLQHIRNSEIRERMNTEETIIEDIEKKRLLWYGHLRRMEPNRWPQRMWQWSPPERRKKGRPAREWMEGVMEAMERRDMNENDWMDKTVWRLGCEKRPN